MKTKYLTILCALLASLFVYTFYRTEHTVVNVFIIKLVSPDDYHLARHSITSLLPLNDFIIYSLPEGLWIYCITLLSKQYIFRLNESRIPCTIFPFIYATGLELTQLLHLMPGRFDFMDVWVSFVAWLLAIHTFNGNPERDIASSGSGRLVICVFSYSIVYLSHVTT